MINHAFHSKKLLKWKGLVFHWYLYNKWTLQVIVTWSYKISLLVLKNIHLFAALTRDILFTTQREIFMLVIWNCCSSSQSRLKSGTTICWGTRKLTFQNIEGFLCFGLDCSKILKRYKGDSIAGDEVLIYPELTLFPLDPSKKLFFPL